jgi:hypothetical protein
VDAYLLSGFRITVRTWPGNEVPRVNRYECDLRDTGVSFGDILGEAEALPDDALLQEFADLDHLDPGALVAWMERFGPLVPVGHDRVGDLAEPISKHYYYREHEEDLWTYEFSEIALRVQLLRAFGATWHALTEGDEDQLVGSWVANSLPEPSDPLKAVAWFADGLSAGLRTLSPRVVASAAGLQETSDPFGPSLTSYNVLCGQLAEQISRGVRWLRCCNERCGRLFEVQRGRALYGQHRTVSVKYCSSSCARAQAQRAYAQRRKDRKEAFES